MQKKVVANIIAAFLFAPLAFAGLYISSLYSYDLFHFLAENFSIVIGICIFIIAWNTRKITSNKFLLFAGIALLFVAFIDLAHAMSYKGMGLIPEINEPNVATQLWIAARYLQAGSLLFALVFVWGRRTLPTRITVSFYTIVTLLVFASIFIWENFPACFVEGEGLTPFKIVSEYIIITMLFVSAVILYLRRTQALKNVWILLILSFAFNIASELAFTQYISVFGFANFLGHILKIIAFYLFYRALITSVLSKPFDTLFFELSRSHESLKKAKTALEVSEASLKRERDQTQIYLQSIGKGVVAIDRQWNITLWDAEVAAMSGYSSTEVMGKDFRDAVKLLKENDRRENISYIEDAMAMRRTVDVVDKTLLVSKSGEEVPVGGSAAPILSKNGDVDGAIIIIRDTTIEREMSAMRSDFTYASHQLRTPVTKAMWQLEAVLTSDDSEKIKKGAKEAYQALKSVNRLSNELADVSEIDQESIVPTTEPIKLADLCAEVIKGAKNTAAENGIEVVLEPVSPTESLVTNARLLKRALSELVDNAIIYSHRGSKVSVQVSRDKQTLTFKIKDSGIGIEQNQQPLIFTKFFRGSNFDTSAIAGAGLGLYVAASYVKLLKGRIWFRATPGEGSTFFLSIPTALER